MSSLSVTSLAKDSNVTSLSNDLTDSSSTVTSSSTKFLLRQNKSNNNKMNLNPSCEEKLDKNKWERLKTRLPMVVAKSEFNRLSRRCDKYSLYFVGQFEYIIDNCFENCKNKF